MTVTDTVLGCDFARNRSYFFDLLYGEQPGLSHRWGRVCDLDPRRRTGCCLSPRKNPKAHPLPRNHLGCRRFGQHHVVDWDRTTAKGRVATANTRTSRSSIVSSQAQRSRPTLSLLTGLASFLFYFQKYYLK